jgi:hypothetical protein
MDHGRNLNHFPKRGRFRRQYFLLSHEQKYLPTSDSQE